MNKEVSIPDYYTNQRRIADRYGVQDHLAGCYIYHFPGSRVCVKCPYVHTCEKIFEQEMKEKDV